MDKQLYPSSGTRSGPEIVLLAILFSVLVGCSAGQKVRTEAVKKEPPPVDDPQLQQKGSSSVVRLDNGKEGFIITETPNMDEVSRRDFDRALAMMEEKEYEKAVALLEKVAGQSPGITAPYINLAIAFNRLDEVEAAEAHLKSALEIFPAHPVASNEYGLLLRRAGRFAEARSVYEKALSVFPEYLPVRRNLGILCEMYLGDLSCALEQYEFYSDGMPEDERVKIWIADLRMRLGR